MSLFKNSLKKDKPLLYTLGSIISMSLVFDHSQWKEGRRPVKSYYVMCSTNLTYFCTFYAYSRYEKAQPCILCYLWRQIQVPAENYHQVYEMYQS